MLKNALFFDNSWKNCRSLGGGAQISRHRKTTTYHLIFEQPLVGSSAKLDPLGSIL